MHSNHARAFLDVAGRAATLSPFDDGLALFGGQLYCRTVNVHISPDADRIARRHPCMDISFFADYGGKHAYQ